MKSFKQFLKEAYKKPDEVESLAVPNEPTEPFITTPFEIYKSIYGNQASGIIQKARDYRKEHPGIENRVTLPDYSDAAIHSRIAVDKSKPGDQDYHPGAVAFVSPANPDRIAVRDDFWDMVTKRGEIRNSTLGHENQHILQMSGTPDAAKLRSSGNHLPEFLRLHPYSPFDNDAKYKPANSQPNWVEKESYARDDDAYRYALSDLELPAHISQMKSIITKKTGNYPYAKDSDELLKHLSGVEDEYKRLDQKYKSGQNTPEDDDNPSGNPTFMDVVDLLKKDPELGLDYWNSVAKRNQTNNQRVT